MLSKGEFTRWVEASHELFEIFEGRYDAYPLARKWIDEWFLSGKFTVVHSEKQRIANLTSTLNFDAFGVKDLRLQEKMRAQLLELLDKMSEEHSNIGFAVSFFLFTWNLQRFKHYFNRRSNFSIVEYFKNVGNELERLKKLFEFFRDKSLLSGDLYEEKVINVYTELNKILKSAGIGNNEPIGTIKLLHVISPNFFPLLDNPIAEQMGLKKKGDPIDVELYIKWMEKLKYWLRNYQDVIGDLERKYKSGILKLIDEGFYIMCSVRLHIRVSKLGI